LQNIPKIAKRHELKTRREARRKIHKSRISNAKASKALRVESVHISHDSTGTQVEEGAKEHIQASQPSNIITASYHRIPAVVRTTSQVQQSRPPEESPQARSLAYGLKSTNMRV
jgi:hypothetical protein